MQTCDGDFCGPFAGAVEDALSHCFHVTRMALFIAAKNGSELLRGEVMMKPRVRSVTGQHLNIVYEMKNHIHIGFGENSTTHRIP